MKSQGEDNIFQTLIQRIKNMQTLHWRIAKGMAWVTFFVFIAKIVSAAKEMAIAYRYGVSEIVDSYVFAFTIVTWLPTVWHSVLEVVLVPIFVQLSKKEKHDFYAELIGFTLVIGVILTVLFLVWMPYLVPHIFTGFSGTAKEQVTVFVMGLAPVAIAGMLVGTLFTRLLAEERHANTMMEMLPSLFVLLAVLVWPNDLVITHNSEPLLYGTLIGFAMYVCGLWFLLIRADITSRPRWRMHSPAWRMMWQGFGYMFLGQFIISVANPIDQLMVAQLGEGAIATLSYANRVLALILGLGATAVGRAILPVLSEAVLEPQNAWQLARRWSQLLLFLGIASVIMGWFLAPLVISLLFERGEFSPEDTLKVVEVFRYGLVQVPFYFSSIVLLRFLASHKKYAQITIISSVVIILKIPMNYFLIKWLGVPGVALGTGLMYLCSWLMSMIVGQRLTKKGAGLSGAKENMGLLSDR